MYQVPFGSVSRGQMKDWIVPNAIDIVCPHCHRDVTFPVHMGNDQQVRGLPVAARCPRCGNTVDVIRLGAKDEGSMRVYVDAEQSTREPVDGLDLVPAETFPEPLRRAYESALRVFSIGEPEAAFAASRRVLEGIVARLLEDGKSREPLARRLGNLSAKTDALAQPVLDLSNAIRAGGNLGAHFDEELITSLEDARHMLDLLDLLISYVFVIPERTRRFRADVLKEPSREADNADRRDDKPDPDDEAAS